MRRVEDVRLLDPVLKAPFAGNIIPASRIDRIGQALARLTSETSQVKLDTARSQLSSANLKLQQLTEKGTPEDVAEVEKSLTGQYLRRILKKRPIKKKTAVARRKRGSTIISSNPSTFAPWRPCLPSLQPDPSRARRPGLSTGSFTSSEAPVGGRGRFPLRSRVRLVTGYALPHKPEAQAKDVPASESRNSLIRRRPARNAKVNRFSSRSGHRGCACT